MSVTAEAETGGRMWRKVVAFYEDQEEALRKKAAVHPTEPGNVSAVIRDAVDAYCGLEQTEGREGGTP